ncbi:uncharacterized protein LOC144139676 [Haemaphysalis longicornis]
MSSGPPLAPKDDSSERSRSAGRTGRHPSWLLFVFAVLNLVASVVPGAKAFTVSDHDKYVVVDTADPVVGGTVKDVRLMLSKSNQFAIFVTALPHELYGRLSIMEKSPGFPKLFGSIILQNTPHRAILSSLLNLRKTNRTLRITYVLPDGTTLVNSTFLLTPYSYEVDIFCSTLNDCRQLRNGSCVNGICRCDKNVRLNKHHQFCMRACTSNADCRYLGVDSSCGKGTCDCTKGREIVHDRCTYPNCFTDDHCVGGVCHNGVCMCPSGYWDTSAMTTPACVRHSCIRDDDCSFWLNTDCARYHPGTQERVCVCNNRSARLYGSCNPTDNLGPCPYGRCAAEYSECDPVSELCVCREGYKLYVYGKVWKCEKEDLTQVERTCQTADDCFPGEICDDNVCTCPKGTELKGLKCVRIVLPKERSVLGLILWLSAIMLAVIVVFISFGCCLYILAQRAENEQNDILKMFEATDQEDQSMG